MGACVETHSKSERITQEERRIILEEIKGASQNRKNETHSDAPNVGQQSKLPTEISSRQKEHEGKVGFEIDMNDERGEFGQTCSSDCFSEEEQNTESPINSRDIFRAVSSSTVSSGIENAISHIKKGKTEKENLLIISTLKSNERTSLPLIEMENGTTYKGQWLLGRFDGTGVHSWPDGAKYVGQWKWNEASGLGVLSLSDKTTYEGSWLHNRAHGHGTYTNMQGLKYVGEWKADKPHGRGSQQWGDGQVYHGEYKNGCRHGKGTLRLANGDHYEGEFDTNEMHGLGSYFWLGFKQYVGQWEHNKIHGKGKMNWQDGRSYQGEFQCSKRHGQGVFSWGGGRKYAGKWVEGKPHGRGVFWRSLYHKRVGEWVEGKNIKWVDGVETDPLRPTNKQERFSFKKGEYRYGL